MRHNRHGNKSIDMGTSGKRGTETDEAGGETGLPEHDDEILRQLNQMTNDIMNEDKAANLYLL